MKSYCNGSSIQMTQLIEPVNSTGGDLGSGVSMSIENSIVDSRTEQTTEHQQLSQSSHSHREPSPTASLPPSSSSSTLSTSCSSLLKSSSVPTSSPSSLLSQQQQQQQSQQTVASSNIAASSSSSTPPPATVKAPAACSTNLITTITLEGISKEALLPSAVSSSCTTQPQASSSLSPSTVTVNDEQVKFINNIPNNNNNNNNNILEQTTQPTPTSFTTIRPNLDLTKLYRKSSIKILESSFYCSDSSSSTSLSVMLSPEVVTNLSLLDHENPESMIENLNKISIHHQDAEVSIADATDCLRQVGGKLDWYHRKQVFCPHLMTPDDAIQIAAMHQKILYEEIPFLELKNRLKDDLDCDFPRELEGRFLHVCGLFIELKNRIQDLINSLSEELLIAAGRA